MWRDSAHTDVPFGGPVVTTFHLRDQILSKTFIWGCICFSSLTRKILKSAYYQKYFIDFNQILHNTKDHQMLIVGCPNTHPTNPRWRYASVCKISPKSVKRLRRYDDFTFSEMAAYYYHLLRHTGSPHTHNSIQPHRTSTYTTLHTKIYKNTEKD